jgi:hypothetical protein
MDMMEQTPQQEKEYVKVHVIVERELYRGIWEIVKKRYESPTRKFHIIINEALREYLENHRHELSA